MDSSELDRLRQARLQELQAQGSTASQGPGATNDGQTQAQQDEMRASMLSQVLEPAARERLARVALVRPDRARQVEEYISRLAQSGQLRQRLRESDLVSLLDQVAQQAQTTQKIVFSRRTDHNSDDDETGFDRAGSSRGRAQGLATASVGDDDDGDDFFD